MGRLISNLLPDGKTQHPNVDAALTAAGVNYDFKKYASYARVHDDITGGQHGTFVKIPDQYGLVRSDTGKPLPGVTVAGKYEVISNSQAFAPLNELRDKHGVKINTAGSLDEGKMAFIHMTAPGKIKIAGDEIIPHFFALTRHDGRGLSQIYNAPERFVCTNQLRAIIRDAVFEMRVKHTVSAHARLADAKSLMKQLVEGQKQFVEIANDLLNQTFTQREFEKLIRTLMPKPTEEELGREVTDRMLENWENRFQTIMSQSYFAADLGNVRGTKWGALNAISDHEQHHVTVRGDDEKQNETLFKHAYLNGAWTRQAAEILGVN